MRQLFKNIHAIVTIGCLAAVLVACGNPKDANKSNFQKAIQAFLDTKPNAICAPLGSSEIPFTLAKNTFADADIQRQDALAQAGLLIRKDTTIQQKTWIGDTVKTVPGVEYNVTEEGKKYVEPGKSNGLVGQLAQLCFGKVKVTGIGQYTEPADAMGMKISRVQYSQEIQNIPSWANDAKVQAAFPAMARELQKKEAKTELVLTNEGWVDQRAMRK